METGLLNLDMGDVDAEDINTIFRAAHSIKGGSGTFGFTSVSDFTHVMETLLDEMRDGRRQVTQPAVDVLLGSVDCLKEMLTAIQDGDDVDTESVAEYQKSLEIELNGREETGTTELVEESVKEEAVEVSNEQGWHIAFSPHSHLLKTGNDPVRMFRELSGLGNLKATVDLQGVPDFYDLDPEDCHLSWKLELVGNIPEQEIGEIFDWVEDECDLAIQPIFKQNEAKPAEESEVTVEKEINNNSVEKENSAEIAKPVAKKKAKETTKPAAKTSSSIRVDTGKIDTLINMVGELVITQSMLSLVGENFEINKLDQLKNGLSQLERHTRELQESVMNIRMLPINFVFSRFPRLVHDLSTKLDKKIELVLIGENTEVDKTVVELLSDPLVHLVRNSLDHGIEMPADRIAVGKPETGTITLEAYHRGGNIVIEVRDDGKGLNKEILKAKAIEKGLIEEDAVLTDKQTFRTFITIFACSNEVTSSDLAIPSPL
jgi:two-component system chemotaxis sensor kinase CheA